MGYLSPTIRFPQALFCPFFTDWCDTRDRVAPKSEIGDYEILATLVISQSLNLLPWIGGRVEKVADCRSAMRKAFRRFESCPVRFYHFVCYSHCSQMRVQANNGSMSRVAKGTDCKSVANIASQVQVLLDPPCGPKFVDYRSIGND